MAGERREIKSQAGGQGEKQRSREREREKKQGFVDYDSGLLGHLSV